MHISLVRDPATLEPRRAEWNSLAARSATHTPFQTWEWTSSWWKSFGGDAESLLLLAESEGRLVGIAPLMASEKRILGRRRRVVEFIGAHAGDYADFLFAPGREDVAARMLAWVAEEAGGWDLLHLINLAETSPLLALVPQAFRARGYAADVERLYECPTRRLHDRAADEKMLRRKENRVHYERLCRKGKVEFTVHVEPSAIDGWLERFFAQHIKRWAPTETPSIFNDPRHVAFYREQVRRMAPHGWIVLSVLCFDGVPISFQFGYDFGNRLYLIKHSFDQDYRTHGPGIVQLRHVLQYGMARGADEVDFTTGQEPYKYRFTNHARVNYAVRVRRGAMFFGVDRVLRYAKAATARAPALRRLGGRVLKPLLGDTFHRLGL